MSPVTAAVARILQVLCWAVPCIAGGVALYLTYYFHHALQWYQLTSVLIITLVFGIASLIGMILRFTVFRTGAFLGYVAGLAINGIVAVGVVLVGGDLWLRQVAVPELKKIEKFEKDAKRYAEQRRQQKKHLEEQARREREVLARKQLRWPTYPQATFTVPELTAPPLSEPITSISIKPTISNTTLGGGGRYLILQAGAQLLCFDVSQAKVIWQAEAYSDCLFAANLTSVIAVDPDAKKYRRYSIVDGQVTGEGDFPCENRPHYVGMGCCSLGPLLVSEPVSKEQLRSISRDDAMPYFLDPVTLKPLPIQPVENEIRGKKYRINRIRSTSTTKLVPAANGRVFGLAGTGRYSPSGLRWLTLLGNEWQQSGDHTSPRYALPTPHGRTVFSHEEFYAGWPRKTLNSHTVLESRNVIPAIRNDSFYVRSTSTDFPFSRGVDVGLYCNPGFRLTVSNMHPPDLEFRLPYRGIYFYPKLDLILTLEPQAIHLNKIGLGAALEKTRWDYVAFISYPPTTAQAGETWTYEPEVRHRFGNVTFRLAVAPADMLVDREGKCVWKVPADAPLEEHAVVLVATSQYGLTAKHCFRLTVCPAAGETP